MSEDGFNGNPYTPGTWQWYFWNRVIGPHVLVNQRVISEKDLAGHFAQGYTFVHQLQSGAIVVARILDPQMVMDAGRQALAKSGQI
ncbi:MAG TPA: hypothetical protein VFG24_08775 [Nitrosopumilaceae archaeon]|nr:hypothetical protein [Nitrosopumilaceae archaeon]